jgi:hypothetical protein
VAATTAVFSARQSVVDLLRASLVGALFVATPAVAVWAIGGLEQPLLAGLLAVALVALRNLPSATPSRRELRVPAWSLAFLCWVRPDGAMFVALSALCLLARGLAQSGALQTLVLVARFCAGRRALSRPARPSLVLLDLERRGQFLGTPAHLRAHHSVSISRISMAAALERARDMNWRRTDMGAGLEHGCRIQRPHQVVDRASIPRR